MEAHSSDDFAKTVQVAAKLGSPFKVWVLQQAWYGKRPTAWVGLYTTKEFAIEVLRIDLKNHFTAYGDENCDVESIIQQALHDFQEVDAENGWHVAIREEEIRA